MTAFEFMALVAAIVALLYVTGSGKPEPPDYGDYRGDPNYIEEEDTH
jgi:hypothetical protein